MSKKVCLLVCLLGGFTTSVLAQGTPPQATSPMTEEKREADIDAYFRKTPEELQQDALKQRMQEQEWVDEQAKQAKKKKSTNSTPEKGAEVMIQPAPTTPLPAAPPSTPEAGSPAPKPNEDYSRGY